MATSTTSGCNGPIPVLKIKGRFSMGSIFPHNAKQMLSFPLLSLKIKQHYKDWLKFFEKLPFCTKVLKWTFHCLNWGKTQQNDRSHAYINIHQPPFKGQVPQLWLNLNFEWNLLISIVIVRKKITKNYKLHAMDSSIISYSKKI